MNIPFGMMVTDDVDRLIDPDLGLAHCHDVTCAGHDFGFVFWEETELCPFCSGEEWS